MTKKEFKELADVHRYTGGGRDNNVTAVFFEWKSGTKDNKVFAGFKYCVYARAVNATTEELLKALYDFVTGKTTDIKEWWINLIFAENDLERFKVPIYASDLYKYKIVDNE